MRKMTLLVFFFFFFIIIPFSSPIALALDIINPNRPLADGETLVSARGIFVLGFFSPANTNHRYVGIWYNKIEVQTVVWVANRQTPIIGSGGTLSITGNGTLAVTGNNSTTHVWFTAAANLSHPVAQLLDNGNLVVREVEDPGRYAWQSFDHPTDTMLPGMKIGVDLRTGLNRNLTSWRSPSDPSPGPYVLAMDVQGDAEAFVWNGARRSWRVGPWDGVKLSGIPEMQTFGIFSYEFVVNSDEVYYRSVMRNTSIASRLIVDPTGTLQRLVWIESNRAWNVFWFAPKDQCDSISACGPYGVCDINRSPICRCLQGFEPKSPANWALRDARDGCARRTPLDCRNGTDGFVRVPGTKLPDTTFAAVDRNITLDQCRSKCLTNCSCVAYASANISGGGSGSGCIVWPAEVTDLRVFNSGGHDLYIRLAASDLESPSDQLRKRVRKKVGIIVGSILGALLLGWIGYCIQKKKQRIVYVNNHFQNKSDQLEKLELPLFNLAMIIAATENFHIRNKLGEGGFGSVYKGKLNDGVEIAVKRLAKASAQGDDEFKNEVILIAKLQHRNLVRLLGCCVEGEERILVYEYMDNKGLDSFLFDKEKCAMLDWHTRYNIILGIARGLLYLHQDSRFKIIHRDLKVSNILLDKDMNPKISDFGLARLFGGDEAEGNTRKVVGTYGYMSPEYAMDGIFSVKSDVFSFGVLLLEIISGKKNRGLALFKHHRNLLGYVWNLWMEGNELELVDESMVQSCSTTEASKCIAVGLLCVQEHPEDRPTMPSVVLMLGSVGMLFPTPKRPGFVSAKGPLQLEPVINTQESMTFTMLEGR